MLFNRNVFCTSNFNFFGLKKLHTTNGHESNTMAMESIRAEHLLFVSTYVVLVFYSVFSLI